MPPQDSQNPLQPDPMNNFQSELQQRELEQAEAAKHQEQIGAVNGSGQKIVETLQNNTKELTGSIHDLLLATLVSKDPEIVNVAKNLSKLLDSIEKATNNVKGANFQPLATELKELKSILKTLPAQIEAANKKTDPTDDLKEIARTLGAKDWNPKVNVAAPRVDLTELNKTLKNIETAANKKLEVKTDNKAITDALNVVAQNTKDVQKTIASLTFPASNYVLPYKDINGKATQVTTVESTAVPGVYGVPALNADGTAISGGGGGGGGTEYVQDAVAPANPTAPALSLKRADTPTSTGADGDWVTGRSTAKGEMYVKHLDSVPVTDNGGSLTVDNGGTFAVQAAQSGNWNSRTQDGSGNAITSTSSALDVNIKSNSTVGGIVSTNNSSTSNLAGGAAFTGTADDVSAYSEIRVSVYSSHASATNGLSIQQSSDSTNWDIIDTYTIAATTGSTFTVPRQARYVRVLYTNGATLTTSLRIQTILNRTGTAPSSNRPSDTYTNEVDLVQNQTFNMLYNGTTWDRFRGDTTNGLDVDVTRLPTLANVTTVATVSNVATIGTSVTPGTAATNLGKAEDAGHTSGDVGVMALGVRNDNAATSATTANADYSPISTDVTGTVFTRQSPSNTPTTANVAGSATSVTVLAANAARRSAIFYNDSTADLYLKYGTTASTSSFTYLVPSLGTLSIDGNEYAGRIDGIWGSATGNVRVTETTL